VNAEGHWQKAQELEDTIGFLMSDPQKERHLASLVEDVYGAARHLIAYALQTRHGTHLDTHAGMARLLRERGYVDIANLFGKLDGLRMGRWYGGKGNGEVIEECQKILAQIRQWATG
jgi:hypothetical protein